MRHFSELVYEGYITGTNPVYSEAQFDDTLGLTDRLGIHGYAAGVSGTSPVISVRVEHSFDRSRWISRNIAFQPEVDGVSISGGGEPMVQGYDRDPYTRPSMPFARLKITLGGTSPTAQVRIWVCGRDKANPARFKPHE